MSPTPTCCCGGRRTIAPRGRHRRARRPRGPAGPLTVADADDLTHAVRAASALPAHDGLRDILLRVSRLADDLRQVAELDINPVIARPDGVVAVDARIRVTSRRPPTRSCASSPVRHDGRGFPATTSRPPWTPVAAS
jgi:ATP-grasp domain